MFFLFSLFISVLMGVSGIISPNFRSEKIIINGERLINLTQEEVIQECSLESVVVRYDLNYDSIPTTFKEDWNSTGLTRSEKRQKGYNYHKEKNILLAQQLNLNSDNVYISKYFPCIEVYYSNEEWSQVSSDVYKRAESEYIDQIHITSTKKEVNQLSSALNYMGARDMVYVDKTYTGSGIKVGILEAGILDEDSATLANTDVTVRTEWYYNETVTDHATAVATIIAGTNGIAPDASIYSVEASGGLSGELDWLIENDVDICNMSYGLVSGRGTYDESYTSIIDYSVKNYNLICFAAVGNYGNDDKLVSNPALGYNVIGVGSSGSTSSRIGTSSYLVNSGPEKPNLCGFGNGVYVPGMTTYNGTSIACAINSGLCALTLQQYPYLKERPELVTSAMMASSLSRIQGTGFDQYVGSGLFIYSNFSECYNNRYTYTNTYANGGVYLYTKEIYLNEGQTVKGCLAYLADATSTNSTPAMTNYNLFLTKSSTGVLQASSMSSTSPYEVVEYTATESGFYKLRIYQESANQSSNGDQMSLTYRVY